MAWYDTRASAAVRNGSRRGAGCLLRRTCPPEPSGRITHSLSVLDASLGREPRPRPAALPSFDAQRVLADIHAAAPLCYSLASLSRCLREPQARFRPASPSRCPPSLTFSRDVVTCRVEMGRPLRDPALWQALSFAHRTALPPNALLNGLLSTTRSRSHPTRPAPQLLVLACFVSSCPLSIVSNSHFDTRCPLPLTPPSRASIDLGRLVFAALVLHGLPRLIQPVPYTLFLVTFCASIVQI